MKEEDLRTVMLLGEKAVSRLARSRVAVFGLGGVGSYAAEALARAGIGAIDLIDHDRISLSNINRQLLALHSTVGMSKAEAAAARIRDINPECRVTVHELMYLPETAGLFDFSQYDYILDAVDTVTAKLCLAEQAQAAGTPIISAMGTGSKLDPTAFRIADLYETRICPLARIMRKEAKKRGITHLKVVYSEEEPKSVSRADSDAGVLTHSCRPVPGSVSFVPSVAGLIMAGEVIKELAVE